MRNRWDRIRHAVSFEVLGLAIITPLGAWAFSQPMGDFGVVIIIGATLATLWNFVYNLGFDHALLRLRGRVQKTIPLRVLHAFLFEAGLLMAMLPIIAWHLGVTLREAFWMDIAFAAFYLIYAFCFNWAYDLIFPIPPSAAKPHSAA